MSNNQKQLQQTDEEPPPLAELAKVNDEFVTLDSMAVFKCRSNGNLFATSGAGAPAGTQPTSLDSFSYLLEWFTSDGLRIWAGETGKGKYYWASINYAVSMDARKLFIAGG